MPAMTFLKSISLVEDLAHPVRVAHYRPTSKSIEILRAVIGPDGSRATNVIATYGSGKSIAAMVGGLLVEGDNAKLRVLGAVGERLARFDPDLANLSEMRSKAGQAGMVVALNGYVPDVPGAVSSFLGLGHVATMAELFAAIERHLKVRRADRLAIVWDEFGRHLEALVSRGRAEDLAQVQDLAEWTTRRKAPSATLTLLLHQDFHRYADRLGQVEQAAWKKIEGRFDALRVVEDSDEIYGVIADVAQELTTTGRPRAGEALARQVLNLGLFPFAATARDALDLLRRAAPLTPTALWLLPKIAGRVGQNDRSTFGFLGEEMPEDRSAVVGIEDLYRYFADAMRTDTGVGGSHKRYVETEAARARAESAIEREVLAGTALLHLAGGGSRVLVSRERLLAFLNLGSTHGRKAIEQAVDSLLSRKLLLHRTLTDEISVWQGSDVDVRARVEEEIEALRNASDPLARIGRHAPAPYFSAPAYNHTMGLTRYAQGVFVNMATLRDPLGQAKLAALADAHDALVAMVVDGAREDHASIAGGWLEGRPHLILAFAEQRPDLDAACLRADALASLERDEHLLAMDPLVEREVKELKAGALDYLVSRAALLTDPEAAGVSWFSEGRRLGRGADLRPDEIVSEILSSRFPFTPRIVNEQVVRRRVTAQTKSARKRLQLGILSGGM